MRNRRMPPRGGGLGLAALAAGALLSAPAWATESAASFYLLGSGGPQAAVVPPVPGVFFGNTLFYYNGQAGADRQLEIGGNVVAGIKASLAADFPGVVWVPSTSVLGGKLVLGGILPFGQSWVNAQAVLTGPRHNAFSVSKSDTAFVLGDPVLQAALGWQHGIVHLELVDLVNIPVGQYHEDQLANLAFHRWADDLSFAVTRLDPKDGWDLSAKTGFTFNGENPATDYRTGTEWHLEAAVEKQITPAFALGLQAYQFTQVTGDSGSGAKLGPFEGRVTGFGGEAAYNFKIGKIPMTVRLHGTAETNVQNRLQGHSIWFDLSMPLHVHLPPGAAG